MHLMQNSELLIFNNIIYFVKVKKRLEIKDPFDDQYHRTIRLK
jgi:hypothetical protein